ncbi:MAG: hypothetical protein KME22_13465 [Hassallia sp. WJT32-NPBG1]|nr:hypothetical protein [Hassallia sp. WJT32-NPBG1]
MKLKSPSCTQQITTYEAEISDFQNNLEILENHPGLAPEKDFGTFQILRDIIERKAIEKEEFRENGMSMLRESNL